jgi:hypothetical protein
MDGFDAGTCSNGGNPFGSLSLSWLYHVAWRASSFNPACSHVPLPQNAQVAFESMAGFVVPFRSPIPRYNSKFLF